MSSLQVRTIWCCYKGIDSHAPQDISVPYPSSYLSHLWLLCPRHVHNPNNITELVESHLAQYPGVLKNHIKQIIYLNY